MKNLLTPFVIFLLVACSSTRITSSWNAAQVAPKIYHKILVVALIKDNDLELREKMEQHLMNDLKDNGYFAISSLSEYGPKTFSGMDEESVLNKIKQSGVDGVMTIVLLDKAQEKEYVPTRIYYSPYIVYHGRFWGYYTTMRSRIYEPGYYQENTKYFWESNFYSMDNGKKLIYSVQTRSFNPSSTASLAHEYGKLIVTNMIKQGVLLKPEQTLAAH